MHPSLKGIVMRANRERKSDAQTRATRASATLPLEIYSTLQEIAKQKKVSVAWVIRDAAERYIAEQQALLQVRSP